MVRLHAVAATGSACGTATSRALRKLLVVRVGVPQLVDAEEAYVSRGGYRRLHRGGYIHRPAARAVRPRKRRRLTTGGARRRIAGRRR